MSQTERLCLSEIVNKMGLVKLINNNDNKFLKSSMRLTAILNDFHQFPESFLGKSKNFFVLQKFCNIFSFTQIKLSQILTP